MNEELPVLYEDNHLLAVLKPAGLLSQSDGSGTPDVLTRAKSYIKRKYAKPGEVYLGLVHRLDRNVGGVMLLARTSKAAARLSGAFRDRSVRKIYAALVEGTPAAPEGERVDLLRKDERKRVARIVARDAREAVDASEARLHYRVVQHLTFPPERLHKLQGAIDTATKCSLLEIELLTGRFHQIRAQMSAMGHPILGDEKYNARIALKNWTLCLFACRLELEHPVRREPLILKADPPFARFSQ